MLCQRCHVYEASFDDPLEPVAPGLRLCALCFRLHATIRLEELALERVELEYALAQLPKLITGVNHEPVNPK